MGSYTIEDYQNLIVEIADIEIEASSIAESRQILTELKKREEILIELRKMISKDIRIVESQYLNQHRKIIEKYSNKNSNRGLLNIFSGGEPRKKRTREIKKLNKEKKAHLDPYYDLKYQIDHLLEQIKEAKSHQSEYLKNSFR
ncbi:MAG: hypothetical protein QME14_04715 [Methanobacteriaceae archaeon]|nr:hypothetical protein [Methanobacteriaceae archaeon]